MVCILRVGRSSCPERERHVERLRQGLSMSSNGQIRQALELERISQLPGALAAIDPDLVIEGTPSKDISKLEQVQGARLPDFYRHYLELMGQTLDVVTYYQEIDLGPKRLHEWLGRMKWRSPRYRMIGQCANDSGWDAYLDLGEDGRGVEVVMFEPPRGTNTPALVTPLSSSLSTYLLSVTVLRCCQAMPASGRLGARSHTPGQLGPAGRIVRRAGFEEHPLSGTWDRIFVSPRGLVIARERGGNEPLSITLGCAAIDEWRTLAGQLEHELKMRISGPLE